MRTVVLTYARARRPNLGHLVGLLGGCVVAERDEALSVRFDPDALAGAFCRAIDKLHLPVLVDVVDDPRQR
jgi:hypothetical protein